MDRRRRAGMGSMVARSAPLHRLCHQELRRSAGDRALSERICNRLPDTGATSGAAGQDLAGISRFELAGPGAAAWLDRLIATRVPRTGRCGLGYFLSPKGGVLAEASIAALAEDRFWVMSGAGAEWHDRDWLSRHLPKDG